MNELYILSDDILYRRESFGSLVYNFTRDRYYQFNKDASAVIEILSVPLSFEEIKLRSEQLLNIIVPNERLYILLQKFLTQGILTLCDKKEQGRASKAMTFFTSVNDFPLNMLYMPTIVGAYLSYRCTGRCRHCVSNSSIERNAKGEMTYEDWINSLLKLRNSGIVYLVLTGGDPLCHKDWRLILKFADNLRLKTILLNDLRLFEESDCAIFKDLRYFDHIQVSLDGPNAELNDFIRGDGSFTILMRKIRLLHHAGIKFNIACTVHKKNIDSMRKMAEFARELGAQKIWFNPIAPYGRGATQTAIALSEDELGRLSREYISIVKEGIIEPGNSYWKLAVRELNYSNLYTFNPLRKGPTSVSLATYNMSLDPYGDCYPDSKFRALGKYRLGNILVNSMEQIWHNALLQGLRNKFQFGDWTFVDLKDLISDLPELNDALKD